VKSKTKNRKTQEQIARMVERCFNEITLAPEEDAVQELEEGWYNAAYRIRLSDNREVILKIAPPKGAKVMSYEKDIMATEVAVMRLVSQNPAIPVPEIYAYDVSHSVCDSDYFFMEKLHGLNLEHVKDNLTPVETESIERQIGEIIRQINSFTGTYFGYDGNPNLRANTWKEAFIKIIESLLDDAENKGVTLDFSNDEIRTVVMEHAPSLEEITEPCLVHWDAWHSNFFVEGDQVVGIIDFERALWAEPLMEAQFRLYEDYGITNSLRGYGKTTISLTEEQRNHLYTLHLGLVMNIECYYRTYSSDFPYTFSRHLIDRSMDWLKTH
jgi:aminoglycoside phosphotransferase (APT) family kinase protein